MITNRQKKRKYGAQSVHERRQRRRRIIFPKRKEKETQQQKAKPEGKCPVRSNASPSHERKKMKDYSKDVMQQGKNNVCSDDPSVSLNSSAKSKSHSRRRKPTDTNATTMAAMTAPTTRRSSRHKSKNESKTVSSPPCCRLSDIDPSQEDDEEEYVDLTQPLPSSTPIVPDDSNESTVLINSCSPTVSRSYKSDHSYFSPTNTSKQDSYKGSQEKKTKPTSRTRRKMKPPTQLIIQTQLTQLSQQSQVSQETNGSEQSTLQLQKSYNPHSKSMNENKKRLIIEDTQSSDDEERNVDVVDENEEEEDELKRDHDIGKKHQKNKRNHRNVTISFQSTRFPWKRGKSTIETSFELPNDVIENCDSFNENSRKSDNSSDSEDTENQVNDNNNDEEDEAKEVEVEEEEEEEDEDEGEDEDNKDDDDSTYNSNYLTQEQSQAKRRRIMTRRQAKIKEIVRDMKNHSDSIPMKQSQIQAELKTQDGDDGANTIETMKRRGKIEEEKKQKVNNDVIHLNPITVNIRNKDPLLSNIVSLYQSFESIAKAKLSQRGKEDKTQDRKVTKELTSISQSIRQKLIQYKKKQPLKSRENDNQASGKDTLLEKISGNLLRLAFRLLSQHNMNFEEGTELISSLLRNQAISLSIDDIYNIGGSTTKNDQSAKVSKLLGSSGIVIDGLLYVIGEKLNLYITPNCKDSISSNEGESLCDGNEIDLNLVPLLLCLHAIPINDITKRLKQKSSLDDCQIWASLSKLTSSIPQLNSYSIMEVCLAFIHKLRCKLLSSLGSDKYKDMSDDNKQYKKEQDSILSTVKRLHNSFHTIILDGIDRVGPIVSSSIHQELYPGNQPRSLLSFAEWSRDVITNYQQEGICNAVSSFSCNGAYAPEADDIGTQIADIPIIDVNQNNLTLFCPIKEEGRSMNYSSTQKEDFSFPERQIVKIDFSQDKSRKLFGTLNDKDCALTLTLTSTQWNDSGLKALLSSRISSKSNCTNNEIEVPRKLKLFVKRSEYSTFVKVLTSRGLLLANENDNDEYSSSASGLATLASIKRKFSTRKSQVRDHIEYSTRINDPEQFQSITNQLQALHQPYECDSNVSESVQTSRFNGIDNEVEKECQTQESPSKCIHEVNDIGHLSLSPKRKQSAEKHSQSHQSYHSPPTLPPAVKVTPIMRKRLINSSKTLPHKPELNLTFESRPLEKFSTICCCFGVDKANEVDVEDPKMIDVANTFLSCEEAMVKAQNSIKELHCLSSKLLDIPDLNPEISRCIDQMSKYQEDMLKGSNVWSSLRRDVEEKLLTKLLGKANVEK